MRICCGLTGHLELARRPDLYGKPVIVGRWDEHVVAASEETLPFGVIPGMALRQAEHLCPQATFVLPDEEATARIRELISAALYDLAPLVEVRDEGIAWLDISGVPAAGHSIRSARHRLLKAIGREPRLGLAPGPFSARLAAARARPGRLLRVADAREFLAALPSRELPLDAEQRERLDLLGLRTLGAVASVGPRELESQLGRDGRRAVLLARGLEPDQLDAWRPPLFTSAHRQFGEPVEDREALLFVARALCGDLADELGLRGLERRGDRSTGAAAGTLRRCDLAAAACMTRLISPPAAIDVILGPGGAPESISGAFTGSIEPIARWKVETSWWDKPVVREY